MSDARLPASIELLIADCGRQPVAIGKSGARVFPLTRDGAPVLFLKCASGAAAEELVAEAERLRWLASRTAVPRVIALESRDDQAWLLLQALPGCNAAEVVPDASLP